MDLTSGEMIKITEIVDKDWYRGENQRGQSGIFPSSFVRIVDSFPGDAPPDSADLSSYLKKTQRYENTVLLSRFYRYVQNNASKVGHRKKFR